MTDEGKSPLAPLDRRMLAIMATDVVGYSRQMEADEAGTIARVTAVRTEVIEPMLAAHRVRLVKLMGDGALVVFESVVDAVACAAAIQSAMAQWNAGGNRGEPMVLRIGINLGDVALLDGDVYGDGVNVAARLEQICEPGGVMVSGTAYDHLQGKLGFPLEFAGEQRVKNISRPVRAYRAQFDGKARRRWRAPRWSKRWLAAALALALAAGGGWWVWSSRSAAPANASIAVLPFENLGGDEATRRLANGLTEDIVTELTRFRAIDVIAYNSTRTYAGKSPDPRKVGHGLNVAFVLKGAIQRQDDRIRVSAQLIDTATGADLWSERWDRPTSDVFAVQSELAEAVADQLGRPYSGLIVAAGQAAARRKQPRDLTAYDLYLLGMEAKHRETREGLEAALSLLKRSLAIDPNFARAWVGLAWTLQDISQFQDYPKDVEQARAEAARKAVELDPADADAHAAVAAVHLENGDANGAEAEFDKALGLNPNSADLLSIYAGWASDFGRPDAGAEAADRAIRLNPNTPGWALLNYGYAYFMVGRYEDARRWLERIPRDTYTRSMFVYRAATLAVLGRTDEARDAVAEAMKSFPDLTIEGFADGWGSTAAEWQRIVETMRTAKFPVCASESELKAAPKLRRLPECVSS